MSGFQEKLPIDYHSLVYRGVESDELDYKAAINWNKLNRAGRAKIVRHIVALANTKGGYIVIGVGEDDSGHPSVYTGLNREQLHSFDPSAVGPFVNRHVEPAVDFTIERPLIDNKRYAIIVVRPFSTMPHVCAYGVEGELHQGVFYIRTTDASSRAAFRAIEMHNLIQRALRNQRETLGRMLRGILYDTKSARETPVLQFEDEASSIRNYYIHRNPKTTENSEYIRLEFTVFPQKFDAERFGFGVLRHAAESAVSLLPGQAFLSESELANGYCTNTALRIFPEKDGWICQMNKSGSFYYSKMLNCQGRKLEAGVVVKLIAEMVNFVSRLYPELGFVEQLLDLRVSISNADHVEMLGEVRQASRNKKDEEAVVKEPPAICHIADVRCQLRRTAADLASGREDHAAKLFREIGDRFNLSERYYRNLPRLIKGYLEKRS